MDEEWYDALAHKNNDRINSINTDPNHFYYQHYKDANERHQQWWNKKYPNGNRYANDKS